MAERGRRRPVGDPGRLPLTRCDDRRSPAGSRGQPAGPYSPRGRPPPRGVRELGRVEGAGFGQRRLRIDRPYRGHRVRALRRPCEESFVGTRAAAQGPARRRGDPSSGGLPAPRPGRGPHRPDPAGGDPDGRGKRPGGSSGSSRSGSTSPTPTVRTTRDVGHGRSRSSPGGRSRSGPHGTRPRSPGGCIATALKRACRSTPGPTPATPRSTGPCTGPAEPSPATAGLRSAFSTSRRPARRVGLRAGNSSARSGPVSRSCLPPGGRPEPMRIDVEMPPNETDRQRLVDALLEHSGRRYGDPAARPLGLFLRDGEGNLCGGITGNLRWSWLYVEMLWVRSDLRGQGYGSRLLAGGRGSRGGERRSGRAPRHRRRRDAGLLPEARLRGLRDPGGLSPGDPATLPPEVAARAVSASGRATRRFRHPIPGS